MTESNHAKLIADEGELAADYLEELLDIADLDGDLEIASEADRAAVSIVSDDGGDRRLKRLIGRQGQTLDALQELTRLAVQQQTGERSRLMLDILGYRAEHRTYISRIAEDAVVKVEETGEAVSLKPMNPFERKVVHDVATRAGLYSDSEGIGPERHVVIFPVADDAEDAAEFAAETVAGEGDSDEFAEFGSSTNSADNGELPESAADADSAKDDE